MKERSLLLFALTLIALVFFAQSPNSLWMVCDRVRAAGKSLLPAPDADTAKSGISMLDTIRAANEPKEVANRRTNGLANPVLGGNLDSNSADPEENIERAVAAVPDGELRQALERSLTDNSPGEYRQLLQRRWAEINPSAAASWAAALADSSKALPLIQQTAIVWANKDMAAATTWAESLPQGELRTSAILALGYEAARTLSFEAFDLVPGLPPSVERDALLEHIARQWSASNADEALAWVMQIPDLRLRQQLLAASVPTAAEQNAAAAAAVVADKMDPGPSQDRAAVLVAQRWAKTDPDGAAQWVEQFPDSNAKTAAEAALAAGHVQ